MLSGQREGQEPRVGRDQAGSEALEGGGWGDRGLVQTGTELSSVLRGEPDGFGVLRAGWEPRVNRTEVVLQGFAGDRVGNGGVGGPTASPCSHQKSPPAHAALGGHRGSVPFGVLVQALWRPRGQKDWLCPAGCCA